jgi:hypothetical protein
VRTGGPAKIHKKKAVQKYEVNVQESIDSHHANISSRYILVNGSYAPVSCQMNLIDLDVLIWLTRQRIFLNNDL